MQAAYQQRLEAWTRDLAPRGDPARYLVDRAVRISWQLDRADFHERARLEKRIGRLHRERACVKGRDVTALVDKLLTMPHGPELIRQPSSDDAPREEPSDILARLRSTAEGCRALLGRWKGIWNHLAREKDNHTDPTLPDGHLVDKARIIRLLGFREPEAKLLALVDRRLAAIFQVQELVLEEEAGRILAYGSDDDRDPLDDQDRDPPQVEPLVPAWKRKPGPGSPSPELVAALNAELWTVVDEEHQRLSDLLAKLEAEEDIEVESDDEAAFDDSPEGERLHRYQTTWSRALRRTLDDIARQREQADLNGAEESSTRGPCPCSRLAGQPIEEKASPREPESVREDAVGAHQAGARSPESRPQDGNANSAKRSHREIRRLSPQKLCVQVKVLRKARVRPQGPPQGGRPARGWPARLGGRKFIAWRRQPQGR